MSNKLAGGVGHLGWYFQRLSGLALVLLIGLHFWVNHFDPNEGPYYEAAVRRLSNPRYIALEMAFLGLAGWHGFNGLWLVARDLVAGPTARMIAFGVIWAIGGGMIILGIVNLLTPFGAI